MNIKMIEPVQVKLIHVAIIRLGLSDDDYRMVLEGQFKKKSCKDLTYFQASRLIDYFKTLGFKIPPRKRGTAGTEAAHRRQKRLPGNVVVLPTREQLDMIETLAAKITWRVEGGFKFWMKKYLKIDRVRSVKDAQACIEGLKGMLDHQFKRETTYQNG